MSDLGHALGEGVCYAHPAEETLFLDVGHMEHLLLQAGLRERGPGRMGKEE